MEHTDIIRLNIVECASELGEIHLIRMIREINPAITNEELEEMIWTTDEDGETLIYTEYAQEQFNILYDEYYSLLENLAIK